MVFELVPSRMFSRLLDEAMDDLDTFERAISSRKRKRSSSESTSNEVSKKRGPVLASFSRLAAAPEIAFNLVPRSLLGALDLLPLRKSQEHDKPLLAIEDVKEDDSKMEISLNVSNYKPEELSLNLEGRTLTLEGKQEVKNEGEYSMRSFTRKFELPKGLLLDSVKSSLGEDGQLCVEVHKAQKRPKQIPIEREPAKKRKLA
ncbi:Hsp20/alpha crystallin family protein [Oesophagostomum dentatum]|uniref:Hsp20/alpha crystallin family protein n=1 Tax=Oesophagostomum dentatum TaxID=61180 RepID=A0A0B1S5V9_OESDE|nr:Hsp20/alpha crystallin family protein [Oesophagostomum dentatum]